MFPFLSDVSLMMAASRGEDIIAKKVMEGANSVVASVMDHLTLAANGRDFAYRQELKLFQLFDWPEGQTSKRTSPQSGGDTKDPKKQKQDQNKCTDLTDAKKEELKKKGFLVQKGRALKNCPIKFKCLGNKVLCSRHISRELVCQFTKRGCNLRISTACGKLPMLRK